MVSGESFQQTRDSIGSEPDTFPILKRITENLKIYETDKVTSRALDGSTLFLDSTVQGTGDVNIWAGATNDGYSADTNYVISANNTFYDVYDTTDFVDTVNTDATWSSTDYRYEFEADEILQTNILAKNNATYTQGILTITGNNISSFSLYLSFNNGSNWETVSNATSFTSSYPSTSGILAKAVASSSAVGSTHYIDSLQLRYS